MIKSIKEKLQLLGIEPKRSLGQNFLVSESKIDKIVDVVARSKYKNVIEIGPGLGALTEKLQDLPDKKIKLIEYDRVLAKYWREQGYDVTEADALQYDWSSVSEDTIVVSNLPYQISARITIDLSFYLPIKSMVFMYQKEVAERIQSEISCKEYGLITAFVQNYWSVDKVVDAGAGDFYPVPNVGSRVLVFHRLGSSLPELKFFNFLKECFHQRRKMLLKNIPSFHEDQVRAAFNEMGISVQVRAENISPKQFLELWEKLNKSKAKVVTYNPKYKKNFKDLNIQWIEHYFKVEKKDLEQLDNPESCLSEGGQIFFALENEKVIGTCALYKINQDHFELAKMAVAPESRGKGVGDLLILASAQWAVSQGAKAIMLHSNTILKPAITLYKKHGFETAELCNPDYERCNIEMWKRLRT